MVVDRGPDDCPEAGRCPKDNVRGGVLDDVGGRISPFEAAEATVCPVSKSMSILTISILTWSRKSLKLPNCPRKPLQSDPGLVRLTLVVVACS